MSNPCTPNADQFERAKKVLNGTSSSIMNQIKNLEKVQIKEDEVVAKSTYTQDDQFNIEL
jgi:hypothetical protein